VEASSDPRREPEQQFLPSEEGEISQEQAKTFEEIMQQQERQRRARLTFWAGVGAAVFVALPLIFMWFGFCLWLAGKVAGL
jgi:type VI protein secretion system component VasF